MFVLRNECGYLFKKWFGKIWLSYSQKLNLRGVNVFWKVFKISFVRLKSDVIVSDMEDILSTMSRQLWGYPPNIGLNQFKTVYYNANFLPLNGVFKMLILISGAIFSATNRTNGTKPTIPTIPVKQPWFGIQKLMVDG